MPRINKLEKKLTSEQKQEEKLFIQKVNHWTKARTLSVINLSKSVEELCKWIEDVYGKGKIKRWWETNYRNNNILLSYNAMNKYRFVHKNEQLLISRMNKSGIKPDDVKTSLNKCIKMIKDDDNINLKAAFELYKNVLIDDDHMNIKNINLNEVINNNNNNNNKSKESEEEEEDDDEDEEDEEDEEDKEDEFLNSRMSKISTDEIRKGKFSLPNENEVEKLHKKELIELIKKLIKIVNKYKENEEEYGSDVVNTNKEIINKYF